jgi:hypothetical protein
MGRLGNQMFQYAALKGIATNKGYWYSIPDWDLEIKKCFKIPPTLPNNNYETIYIEDFPFNNTFFNSCPDDRDICGYFQTEKYFKHIKKQIKEDFTFKDEILYKSIQYLNDLNIPTEKIALQVRRTDYLTNINFVNLDLQYYVDALRILNNLPVIVFSDDIQWCKEQTIFKDSRFIFSNLNDGNLDLCVMSMCDYHIIANSSFGWWGSWLAKSKKTVAPKRWFTGDLKDWNTKDLYLNDWIVI